MTSLRFLLWFGWLATCFCLQARNQPRFTHLTLADGLSQSQVLDVVQDQTGFLWFATQDGLNRYDGYNFQVWRDNNSELGGNRITALVSDEAQLWIGTRSHGLFRFDQVTATVVPVLSQVQDAPKTILSLVQDASGTLWVGTRKQGLWYVAPEDGTLKPAKLTHAAQLSSRNVTALFVDDAGMLWIGHNAGLLCIDPVTRMDQKPAWVDHAKLEMIQAIEAGSAKQLWLASERHGLFQLDRAASSLRHFSHDASDPASLSSNLVSSLMFDSQQQLWVGTRDRGLNLLRPASSGFERFQRDIRDQNSIGSNKIWSLFEDRGGVIWIGTGDNGISKLVPELKPFHHVAFLPQQNAYTDDLVITALTNHGDAAWIGTWGQGIYRFDPRSSQVQHFAVEQFAEARGATLVTAIHVAAPDQVWLGVWDQDLVRFNPQSGERTRFSGDFDKPLRITGIQPLDGDLYLSTFGAGLLRFDPESGAFEQFKSQPDDPNSLAGNALMASVVAGPQQLWIPTIDGGLSHYDAQQNRFTRFQHDSQQPDSLANNRITCALVDRQGRLWVGSDGGGLHLQQGDGNRFVRFTVGDGLPNNVINSILEDSEGMLWISTNRGIAHMNPASKQIRVFGAGEGLPLEYNASIASKAADGTLYFGGQRGFVYFDPQAIQDNTQPPPLAFTDLKVFNQSLPLPQSLQHTEALELSYKQNFFAFEFAALDFNNPEANQYAYMLEGFDRAWIKSGTRNYASYTNLAGGSYRFRVKASNSDGYWNETGIAIDLIVIPPFWQTTWFKILVIMIAMGGTGGLVFLIARKKLREVQAARERESEVNQQMNQSREAERLRLAQELHDGPLQDLHAIQIQMAMQRNQANSKITDYLKQVIQNLRFLCGELRPPALGHFGLEVAIRSHTELLKEKYPDLSIKLQLSHDQHSLPAEMRLALFRIFQESVNNAIQHSHCEEIQVTFVWDAEMITLEISDDGSGFAYQDYMEYSKKGHFGLMGISERARGIGGTLKILTMPNRGTAVRVQIPHPG